MQRLVNIANQMSQKHQSDTASLRRLSLCHSTNKAADVVTPQRELSELGVRAQQFSERRGIRLWPPVI